MLYSRWNKNQAWSTPRSDDHHLTSLIVTFSVLDVLRSEARVMEGLRSLLVETPYIHDILKLNVQPSDSDYAVDIRKPAICVRSRTLPLLHPEFFPFMSLVWLINNWEIFFFPLSTKCFCRFSGLTTWRRTTSTARGPTMSRSCSDQLSPESSDKSGRTSTTL